MYPLSAVRLPCPDVNALCWNKTAKDYAWDRGLDATHGVVRAIVDYGGAWGTEVERPRGR